MKVWGATEFMIQPGGEADSGRFKQVRVIVAARSFAAANRALEAADMTKFKRDYASSTGNPTELEVALAEPGTVFAQVGRFGPYKRANNHRYVD